MNQMTCIVCVCVPVYECMCVDVDDANQTQQIDAAVFHSIPIKLMFIFIIFIFLVNKMSM